MLASGMAQADVCMLLGTSMKVTGKKMFGMGREAASMLQGTSTKVTDFQGLATDTDSLIGVSDMTYFLKIAGEMGH